MNTRTIAQRLADMSSTPKNLAHLASLVKSLEPQKARNVRRHLRELLRHLRDNPHLPRPAGAALVEIRAAAGC